jgi:hypothetical protein
VGARRRSTDRERVALSERVTATATTHPTGPRRPQDESEARS